MSASGASTVSVGGGDFSGSSISMAGNFTFDASTSSTGSITMVSLSSIGASTISLGGGSGAILTSAFHWWLIYFGWYIEFWND